MTSELGSGSHRATNELVGAVVITGLQLVTSRSYVTGLALVTSELASGSHRATNELVGAVVIVLIVVALSPVVFVLIYRMTLTIQNYALGLSKKTKDTTRYEMLA